MARRKLPDFPTPLSDLPTEDGSRCQERMGICPERRKLGKVQFVHQLVSMENLL
jgi:hypothetical protein